MGGGSYGEGFQGGPGRDRESSGKVQRGEVSGGGGPKGALGGGAEGPGSSGPNVTFDSLIIAAFMVFE